MLSIFERVHVNIEIHIFPIHRHQNHQIEPNLRKPCRVCEFGLSIIYLEAAIFCSGVTILQIRVNMSHETRTFVTSSSTVDEWQVPRLSELMPCRLEKS